MPGTRYRPNFANVSDTLMILAGACAFVFILIEGGIVYGNTRRTDAAREGVQHSQQVLAVLQSSQLIADRIELGARLYALSRDEQDLEQARHGTLELQALPLQLEPLIADNAAEALNLELTARTGELSRQIHEMPSRGFLSPEALLRCRETLRAMTAQEEQMVQERRQRTRKASSSSLKAQVIFVGLSLLTVAVLFAFLIYDTLLRRRTAREVILTNRELTASVQALEESAYQSRLLTACSDEVQLCVSVQQVYEVAADYMARLLPRTNGSLCMTNHSRNLVEVASYWGLTGLVPGETFTPEACCGLRLGQMRWRRPNLSEIDCTHFPGSAPKRYLCVPMVAQGETLGILSVECVDDEGYRLMEHRCKKLMQVLQLVAMAIASLNLRTKLENQAIRDGMTGVYNRHFMEQVLDRELARAARQDSPLALYMLDVDHFKRFNDTYGHAAGDSMLKAVAQVLQLNVRTEDTVCRYGGEEFAIILPGATPEVAYARAELIRQAVARLKVPLTSGISGEATVSIGMAVLSQEASTGEALLIRADEALYQAKKTGRDRVVVATTLVAA